MTSLVALCSCLRRGEVSLRSNGKCPPEQGEVASLCNAAFASKTHGVCRLSRKHELRASDPRSRGCFELGVSAVASAARCLQIAREFLGATDQSATDEHLRHCLRTGDRTEGLAADRVRQRDLG